MGSKRKKTVLKVTRISENLDHLLEKDATEKRVSVNSLINAILTRYSEWDRYTEKFGFVSITRDAFRSIIDSTDEVNLAEVARDVGGRQVQELSTFWFQRFSIETFLSLLSLFSKYGGVGEYELATEGRNYVITMHHDMGDKWSSWLRSLWDQALRYALRIIPSIETTSSSVVFRFTLP